MFDIDALMGGQVDRFRPAITAAQSELRTWGQCVLRALDRIAENTRDAEYQETRIPVAFTASGARQSLFEAAPGAEYMLTLLTVGEPVPTRLYSQPGTASGGQTPATPLDVSQYDSVVLLGQASGGAAVVGDLSLFVSSADLNGARILGSFVPGQANSGGISGGVASQVTRLDTRGVDVIYPSLRNNNAGALDLTLDMFPVGGKAIVTSGGAPRFIAPLTTTSTPNIMLGGGGKLEIQAAAGTPVYAEFKLRTPMPAVKGHGGLHERGVDANVAPNPDTARHTGTWVAK